MFSLDKMKPVFGSVFSIVSTPLTLRNKVMPRMDGSSGDRSRAKICAPGRHFESDRFAHNFSMRCIFV